MRLPVVTSCIALPILLTKLLDKQHQRINMTTQILNSIGASDSALMLTLCALQMLVLLLLLFDKGNIDGLATF